MNKLVFLSAMAVLLGATSQANLIVNGDFSDGFFTYDVANQGLPGWTVLGQELADNVAIFTPDPPRGFSTNHMDLSGFSDKAGVGISQPVPTTFGQTYQLDFEYWTGDSSVPAVLEAFIDGNSIGLFSTAPNGITPSSFSTTFVAKGFATPIKFLTTDTGAIVDIDNVSVTAVPEPMTLGGLALGVVGLLRRRR